MEDEYGTEWGLFSPKEQLVFPFSKVVKRFRNGDEHDLVAFYDTMTELYW